MVNTQVELVRIIEQIEGQTSQGQKKKQPQETSPLLPNDLLPLTGLVEA